MNDRHLVLSSFCLGAAKEWTPQPGLWWFARAREGSGYWLGLPRRLFVESGSLMIVPGHKSGAFLASQLGVVEVDYFGFDPDSVVGVFTLDERSKISIPSQPPIDLLIAESSHFLCEQFSAMVGESSRNDGYLMGPQLLHFAVLALRTLYLPAQLNIDNSPKSRIEGLIRQTPEDELIRWPTEELANRCRCSPRHFRRIFKELFGQTLQAKQVQLRLLKACRLLAETTLPIGVISQTCGYRHPNLFHRDFKQSFGTTPQAWRMARTDSPSRTAGAPKEYLRAAESPLRPTF